MTTSEKIDFLYSKFVEPNRSSTSVFNQQVWAQGDEIPNALPQFDSNGEYKNASGDVILRRVELVKVSPLSGFPNAFSSSSVFDVVSYENGFDRSYEYKFYTKSSSGEYVEIPFGDGDYFFDHDTGILFFPEGRTIGYNPSSLYITFVQYAGRKGIDTSSQFPGSPQSGAVGPTGPIGKTGQTGPVDPYAIRYKGSWSQSNQYSKWDLVKAGGRFFLSTTNSNTYSPINGTYWQAFGIPQLSSAFDRPNETFWISPSFVDSGRMFGTIDAAFNDLNAGSVTDATMIVYPGSYVIDNNIVVKPGANVNIIFYGRVNVSFRDDSLSMSFSDGSKIEFRGSGLSVTNGSIRLTGSNLSAVGCSLSNIALVTNTTADTARLMAVGCSITNLAVYGSFSSLTQTDVTNLIQMDESSVVHLDGCMLQARPDDEPDQHKIEIIPLTASGTPPGFGYDNPALMIKNSRVLSNGPILKSAIAPAYGMQLGFIASSLYVKDSSVSFLDLTDVFNAFVFDTVVNTTYDETKLQILNVNGGFQTIEANFED